MKNTPGPTIKTIGSAETKVPPNEAVTKATEIYYEIYASIRSGDLKPGEKLPLERLKDTFRTSMSPCREALARLVGEGFVLTEGKKGFHVREISTEDFKSLLELRNDIEIKALKKSIEKRTVGWEARLVARHYLLSQKDSVNFTKKTDLELREIEHRSFHLVLLSECDSFWLLRFYEQLSSHIERYCRIVLPTALREPVILKEIDLEHKQLLDFAITGKTDKAIKLLSKHRKRTSTQILEGMKNLPNPK